ncbi:hypothetical protein HDU81_010742 [Chytriomyces hyalinus]|nr:hypothetical protein HDU81_010742 [Chytriomyces hyalinus]
MFGRKTTRASSPSPSPERQRRYPNTRYDDPIDQLPPPARRARTSPLCLAAGGLAATVVAFIMVALVLLSPFSSMPAFASIGFIRLDSTTTPAADGIQSAILTTWGYCTTASSDSTTTCLPATNLQMLGNYATNFTLSPQPLVLGGAKSYSITQALSLLPYISNPVLIFTLPIIMSLLGLAVISCTISLISFFLKRYTNVWVVCAKFSSTLNIVSFVALIVCVAVAVLANESLAGLAAAIPGITVVKPYAGLALLAVAFVFVLVACVATTYLFIVARREDAFEDTDVELGDYNQPKSESSMQGTVPRMGGVAEKGGRGGADAVRAGSRNSWDDVKDRKQQGSLQRPEKGPQRPRDFHRAAGKPRGGPPDRVARSDAGPDRDRDRERERGGGGAGRGARNDRFSIRSSIQDNRKSERKDAEVKGTEEEPPKSDWGILRTVNGVAGGVYGYFAGSTPKAEEPEEKVEKAPSKDAKSSAASRSGGRGDRRSSFAPPRSRSNNDEGRRRGDTSRDRRGGGGGGGGGDRRGSPDRYRDRSRSRR